MKIEKGFLIDANNNRVDLQLYDKKTAAKMLRSLVGCDDCVNCFKCKECRACLSCQYCTHCIDCTLCNNKDKLKDAFNK